MAVPITQLILLLLSTAGVSALFTTGITAWSAFRERTARRQEMLLTAAIAMANQESQLLLQIGQASAEQTDMKMYPFIVMARWHHRQLTLLLKKGRLSDDLEKTYEEYIEQNRPDAANLISARQDKQSAAFPGAARPGWPGTHSTNPTAESVAAARPVDQVKQGLRSRSLP